MLPAMAETRPEHNTDNSLVIEPEALDGLKSIFTEVASRVGAMAIDLRIIEEGLAHPPEKQPKIFAQAILGPIRLELPPVQQAATVLHGLADLCFFLDGRVGPLILAETAGELEQQMIEPQLRSFFDKKAQEILRGEKPDELLTGQFSLIERFQAWLPPIFDWLDFENGYQPGYFLRSLSQARDKSVFSHTVLPREAPVLAYAIAGHVAGNTGIVLSGEIIDFMVRFLRGENVDIELPRIRHRLDVSFSTRSTSAHGREIDRAAIFSDANRILTECRELADPVSQCEYLLQEGGTVFDAIVDWGRSPVVRDELAQEFFDFLLRQLTTPAQAIFSRHMDVASPLTEDEKTILDVNGFFIRQRAQTQPMVSTSPPDDFGGSIADILPEYADLSPPGARRPPTA